MLDYAERKALERDRQAQLTIERQFQAPKRKSVNCKNGRHRACFALNCTCRCGHGVDGVVAEY
jgi:hypothetical protein